MGLPAESADSQVDVPRVRRETFQKCCVQIDVSKQCDKEFELVNWSRSESFLTKLPVGRGKPHRCSQKEPCDFFFPQNETRHQPWKLLEIWI